MYNVLQALRSGRVLIAKEQMILDAVVSQQFVRAKPDELEEFLVTLVTFNPDFRLYRRNKRQSLPLICTWARLPPACGEWGGWEVQASLWLIDPLEIQLAITLKARTLNIGIAENRELLLRWS